MRAVSRAFHDFQRDSLTIGVVPGLVTMSDGQRIHRTKDENYPNPWVDLTIMTHLPGDDPESESSRNHINVLSADVVIALPGGHGTWAEVRLAKEYGKPVVAFLADEESIHGHAPKELSEQGVIIVQTFRDLVTAVRAVLTPELETRRRSRRIQLSTCLLRLWDWSDAESLQRHANNRNVSSNLLDEFPHPYTARDAERWLSAGESTGTVFAIDVGGSAVGGIGFTSKDSTRLFTAEVGYWLGEDYWGRGIASEALCAVTSYAFASQPDLHRLCAHVFSWNPASMRVLEKAGYQREGVLRDSTIKNGRFVDEILFAKLRSHE
jgi:RimJ/RimL family protein N-acetyltransferase